MFLCFSQGDEKFIDDCIGFLPTKTRDQIDEHEEWYRQFLSISNKRRLALKRWREEKNVRLTFEILLFSSIDFFRTSKKRFYKKLNKRIKL